MGITLGIKVTTKNWGPQLLSLSHSIFKVLAQGV
jgi:hypothetical protein